MGYVTSSLNRIRIYLSSGFAIVRDNIIVIIRITRQLCINCIPYNLQSRNKNINVDIEMQDKNESQKNELVSNIQSIKDSHRDEILEQSSIDTTLVIVPDPVYEVLSSETIKRIETIFSILKLISNVKIYEKFWLENDTLTIDTSYLPRWSRWRSSQKREKILKYIEDILNEFLSISIKYKISTHFCAVEVYNILPSVINGLNNMKITYPDCVSEISKIQEIALNILKYN